MVKIATIILLIALIYSGVYSIMVIGATEFIVGNTFEAITGTEWDSIQNAGYVKTFISIERYMGIFALATVISTFFFLFVGFRKTEKCAWWALLIVGILVWGYGITTNFIEGDMLNSILHVIGAAIFLIGIFLPIKSFFGKTP